MIKKWFSKILAWGSLKTLIAVINHFHLVLICRVIHTVYPEYKLYTDLSCIFSLNVGTYFNEKNEEKNTDYERKLNII